MNHGSRHAIQVPSVDIARLARRVRGAEAPFMVAGANLHERHGPQYVRAALADDTRRWLVDTPLLQIGHDRIRLQALRLTQLRVGAQDKAIACYQYVRELDFYCSADPAGTPSVAVQVAHFGDCFTKGMLFVALLRACSIPARLRFVLVKPNCLRGIMHTGGRSLVHAFTEVLTPAGWLGVDSYVPDLRLSLAARCALINEGRPLGYGLHLHGQVAWDGRSSSFVGFCPEDPSSQPTADLGTFDDVAQFRAAHASFLPANWLGRRHWSFAANVANIRIKRLRASRPAAAQRLDPS
jgi:hypothetical protein